MDLLSCIYLVRKMLRAERTKVLGRCYVCPMFTPIFDLLNVFYYAGPKVLTFLLLVRFRRLSDL